MAGDMKPFRIIGNLYFVGTYKASSHLIDTGDGLILLDTGYAETADVVIASMKELGFDVKDVKYILHSHGHSDHTDGTPKILSVSNAETFLGKADVKYIAGWEPDYYYSDGQVITLGNTSILCVSTPGHTEDAYSFFFDVEENGETYRVGTFGGAGTNQLKKAYLDRRDCSYLNRGLFYQSLDKIKDEHVDVFIGNHSWHNQTRENYELMQTSEENPFIDESRWGKFLEKCRSDLDRVILNDSRDCFVNYAHRGASEYAPENTFISFYTGLFMGANGIETDVQMTKDGVLVLFHDDTVTRLTGAEGRVSEYTLEELQAFTFEKNGLRDKIVVFEDFLRQFAFRDITFAIGIKQLGIEKEVADMLRKYDMRKKTVVTSFIPEAIQTLKKYAPEFRVGLLKNGVDEETLRFLKGIGAEEVCPYSQEITRGKVDTWHKQGFNVRAWGVDNEYWMRHVYDCNADGMTVNFPDKLCEYIRSCENK